MRYINDQCIGPDGLEIETWIDRKTLFISYNDISRVEVTDKSIFIIITKDGKKHETKQITRTNLFYFLEGWSGEKTVIL